MTQTRERRPAENGTPPETRCHHAASPDQDTAPDCQLVPADTEGRADEDGTVHTGQDGPTGGDMSGEAGGKSSQATRLVSLAERDFRILAAQDGTPYAVAADGPNLARPLRGRDGLRQRLARLYTVQYRCVPSGAALSDALTVLEGKAADVEREPVALRLVRHGESIVIDLGDPDGRCVIVEPGGWRVAPRSPVLFRRSALTGVLPVPVPTATRDLLRGLVNADGPTRRLLVGWLVAGLIPELPHPILAVFGEQGTAKTTLLRLLCALIDPSPAPTRTAPRDVRQWAVTASASWLVCLDNVSSIPEWLSDALCRAVTGDALTDRVLYTDSDVSVIAFRRLVAMSSIDAGALRGDLGDRLLPVELDRIEPTARRCESDLDAAFTQAAPKVLGGLLDLLAGVLVQLPRVRTVSLPRMADFAAVLTALDAVTGWSTVGEYAGTATDIAETVIDSDPVACAIRALVPPGVSWSGTAAALHNQITPERPPRGWPRSPRAVSGAVRRITPALRTVGVTVEHGRTADSTRTITLTAAPDNKDRTEPSGPSESSGQGAEQHEHLDGTPDAPTMPGRSTVRPSERPSRSRSGFEQRTQAIPDGLDGPDGGLHHESDDPATANPLELTSRELGAGPTDPNLCESCGQSSRWSLIGRLCRQCHFAHRQGKAS